MKLNYNSNVIIQLTFLLLWYCVTCILKYLFQFADPYSSMMPMTSRQMPQLPARYALPGVEAKLQNTELWTDFHKIGTEMIITKCGR